MTAPSLPAALRAGAQGIYALEAAAGLVIAHGTWLARDDFRCFIYLGPETAAIDWEAVTRLIADGELPSSAAEGRVLQLAASLACGAPIVLGDAVTGLDDRNIQVVVTAIRRAFGQPDD